MRKGIPSLARCYGIVANSPSGFPPYLAFLVTPGVLSDFFLHKTTLRDIIHRNAFVYFVDVEPNLNTRQVVLVATSNIPQRYLPLTGSDFDEKGFEDYALELKGNISAYRSTLNQLRKELVKRVAL